jgi:hypothetical protein
LDHDFEKKFKKFRKIQKNLEKSCDQISARITMPNAAKLKIFAKYYISRSTTLD